MSNLLLGVAMVGTVLGAGFAHAQEQPVKPLVVYFSEIPGVSEDDDGDGKPEGYGVDLIHIIAAELGRPLDFRKARTSELVGLIQNGEADLVGPLLTLTRERSALIDFSYPVLPGGGQSIMVRGTAEWSLTGTLGNLKMVFTSKEFWMIFGFIEASLVVLAFLMWVTERRAPDGDIDHDFWKGMVDALYLANTTATSTGYGDETCKTFLGRTVAVGTQWYGIAAAGVVIGIIASAMVSTSLDTDISRPGDLRGKTVLTKEGSHTAELILPSFGVKVVTFPTVRAAMNALLENDEYDALVYDSPVIRRLVNVDAAGEASIVGAPFNSEFYGFGMPRGSKIKSAVDNTIAMLWEDGRSKVLIDRWGLDF